MDNRVSGLISGGLQSVYRQASERARTGIAEARAAEGASAFDRIVDNPGGFAAVESATYAPHLREAYRYQEWLAAERGVSLPDTHLLDKTASAVSSGYAQTSDDTRAISPARDALRIRQLLNPDPRLDLAAPTLGEVVDYGVTRRDLEAIQAIVERFPTVEWGSRVLASLTKVEPDGTTELDRWAENLRDAVGGFDQSERQTHYVALAAHLDAPQLTRFAHAVSNQGSRNETTWFGYSIRESAPSGTLAAFIPSATTRGRETKGDLAPVVAQAIYGLSQTNPQALTGVLSRYTERDVDWLTNDAAYDYSPDPTVADLITPEGTNVILTRDVNATSLSWALKGVAISGSSESRSLFFSKAADRISSINEMDTSSHPLLVYTGVRESTQQIAFGLTDLVQMDAAGMLNRIRERYPDGTELTSYVKELLVEGNMDLVRDMLDRLVRGNSRIETPQARFGEEDDPESTLQEQNNASTLGYYTGAVAGALTSITADRDAQAAALESLFSVATSVGVAVTGGNSLVWKAARSVGADGGKSVSGALAGEVVLALDEFKNGRGELAVALLELARPRVPNESGLTETRPYTAPSIRDQFNIQRSTVE